MTCIKINTPINKCGKNVLILLSASFQSSSSGVVVRLEYGVFKILITKLPKCNYQRIHNTTSTLPLLRRFRNEHNRVGSFSSNIPQLYVHFKLIKLQLLKHKTFKLDITVTSDTYTKTQIHTNTQQYRRIFIHTYKQKYSTHIIPKSIKRLTQT